jgi:hypothetical protein
MQPCLKESEMHWFWMNVPLAAAFFAIWTGVPLWLVLKHPDIGTGAGVPDTPRQEQVAESTAPEAGDVHTTQHASSSRAFAGTPR